MVGTTPGPCPRDAWNISQPAPLPQTESQKHLQILPKLHWPRTAKARVSAWDEQRTVQLSISDLCFGHQWGADGTCVMGWSAVLEPLLDLPSTQGHGRTVSGSEPTERGAQRGSATRTLQPPAQLLGGEENGQLALAVGRLRVVLPLLPVQILEVYVPSNVGQGRDVDDARRGGGFQLVQ